jgi:hypothetical protein
MMAVEAAICGEGTKCQGRRPPNLEKKEKETNLETRQKASNNLVIV